jgi:hypothetical protein
MRWPIAVFLLSFTAVAHGASSNAQALVQAFDSETEQAVCDRAYREASDRATADIVDQARSLKTFHKVLDDYRFAGKDREALKQDLARALQTNGQWTEVQRVWSGRSCLVQLLLETQVDEELQGLVQALPPRKADEGGVGSWWDSLPGLTQFSNNSALAGALSEMMPVKTYVAEFWFSNGRFPDSLSEIGIDAGAFNSSKVIERVVMEPGGEIHAVLKGDLGGEWVILTPSDGPMGALNWRCTTSVATMMSGCEGP